MEEYGPDSLEARWVSVADFCENSNEFRVSIKWVESRNYKSKYQPSSGTVAHAVSVGTQTVPLFWRWCCRQRQATCYSWKHMAPWGLRHVQWSSHQQISSCKARNYELVISTEGGVLFIYSSFTHTVSRPDAMNYRDRIINFLGCKGVLLGILPGLHNFKIMAQRFFEKSGPPHATSHRHIPEDLNPQQYHCVNVKYCKMVGRLKSNESEETWKEVGMA